MPKIPVPPRTPSTRKVRLADASLGLAMIDPYSGITYSHDPVPLTLTTWTQDYLRLGVLVEV
jgi:hypothetical protein